MDHAEPILSFPTVTFHLCACAPRLGKAHPATCTVCVRCSTLPRVPLPPAPHRVRQTPPPCLHPPCPAKFHTFTHTVTQLCRVSAPV